MQFAFEIFPVYSTHLQASTKKVPHEYDSGHTIYWAEIKVQLNRPTRQLIDFLNQFF